MKAFFLVFFAGGVGSTLRYAVQLALQGRFQPAQFPWATFAVNLLGCFLIGLFHALSSRFQLSPETRLRLTTGLPETRLLLTTGLCGGFTTFSTFCNESLSLLRQGYTVTFACYIGFSVALGLVAVWAGNAVAR